VTPPEPLAAIWRAGDPRHAALVVPEDGVRLTFDELAGDVEALAERLARLGVVKGDRVCLALPNGRELIELLLALTALGAASAPLNPAYTEDEFRFYLDDLAPRLVLVPAGELAAARSAAGAVELADVHLGAGAGCLGPGRTAAKPTTGGADDVAIVLHTSGTTSRPKQVPLLQRNLVASARSMVEHYRLDADDVSCLAMPLFHVHGLVASTFAALLSGGTVVVPRRLSRRFHDLLADERVTWFSAGPTIHHMLLERGSPDRARLRLRFIRSCSSALSSELLARTEAAYGAPMLEAYGMTEASHEIAANPLPPAERRPETVGVPTGCGIRVVDDAWQDVPPGSPGEVAINGPGVTPGYLANPEANAESFSDGWFRTGDQGMLEDGYLRLVGRIKELIIRGGENISPVEVEDVLKAHPAVSDAAVFGIPDEKYGEIVAAAVAVSEPVAEDDLADHCRVHLTAVKIPHVIHLIDEIPRTATGKLQRRRIAAALYGK
jgi:acyl-CoA synthetase (AMP-forming)/AMP-acid ligase II